MAHFSTAQKCILAASVSIVLAYGSGNFVIFTGFGCSVALGWFLSISLLRFRTHLASECLLDLVTFFTTKYHMILKKIYGENHLPSLASKEPPQPKNETPAQEIKLFLDLILQDFISSWYDYISEDHETFEEIQEILEDLSVSCLRKVKLLDVHQSAENVFRLFQKHLAEFQDTKRQWQLQPNFRKKGNKNGPEFKKKKTVVQMYKNLEKLHVCLNGDISEYRYTLAIVDTLLKVLLDDRVHRSYTVKELVCEILAVNVIQNVVNLLSDPHFLHKAIILLTSDEKLIIVDNLLAPKTENITGDKEVKKSVNTTDCGPIREEPDGQSASANDLNVKTNECSNSLFDDCDKKENVPDTPEPNHANESEERSFLWGLTGSLERVAAHKSVPVLRIANTSSTPACISENENHVLQTCLLGISPVDPEFSRTNSAPDLTLSCEKSVLAPASMGVRTHELARPPSLPLLLDDAIKSHQPADIPADESAESSDGQRSFPKFFIGLGEGSEDGESPIDSEISSVRSVSPELHSLRLPRTQSDKVKKDESGDTEVKEAMEAVEGLEASTHVPPRLLFAEVSIPKAESAREPYNNHTYTLYDIQYMAWHKYEDESWVLKQDFVKRRYREFITLQDRLESHALYKKTIRKIKGPSRWNTLHVGQMQDQRIENRRQFLQTYLRQLIEKEDVGNSMAIKEFLAYEGDASIAFVKKAREIPRFDKVIVKTVSGVFNRISSALPIVPDEVRPNTSRSDLQSPQGLDSSEVEWEDPDRLNFKFELANSEALKERSEVEDIMNNCIHATEKDGAGSSSSSSSSYSCATDKDEDFRDALEVSFLCLPRSEGDGSEETSPPVVEATDSSIPLCSAVLDLAALSADKIESWVCKEKIVYLIKVLLGRALERFLHDEISDLTTETRWTFYLETLRETLWPDGQWDTQPVEPPSEDQKIVTKHQAHQCLAQFFPDFIPSIVGYEDYDKCIEEIMESLQYPELNKHFVYCVLDHMLDMTFQEFESGQLHEELLTTKNVGEDLYL